MKRKNLIYLALLAILGVSCAKDDSIRNFGNDSETRGLTVMPGENPDDLGEGITDDEDEDDEDEEQDKSQPRID